MRTMIRTAALAKGAFFNLDQMTFEIAEGKTTTLEVHPVIESESTFLLKFTAE